MTYNIISEPGTDDMRAGSRLYTTSPSIERPAKNIGELRKLLGEKLRQDMRGAGELAKGPSSGMLSAALRKHEPGSEYGDIRSARVAATRGEKNWRLVE
jgi:hypothetical protein